MSGSNQYISFFGFLGYLAICAKIPRSHFNNSDIQYLILDDLLAKKNEFL